MARMSFEPPITRETPIGPVRSGGSFSPGSLRVGPVTAVLIGISIAVTLLTGFGENRQTYFFLLSMGTGLPEVRHGEVWRLITPIFLHLSFWHILFNMMWLKDLGTIIELRTNSLRLLALVLATGLAGNLGQCYFAGPIFGGMSGVVYGLLGYVWMKARFDPASGFYLEKQTVILMLGWLVACMVGVIPNVANYAHGFGFAVGIAWGFAEAQMRPRAM